MPIKVHAMTSEPDVNAASMVRSGDANVFSCTYPVQLNGVNLTVIYTLLGSTQIAKDGTRRVMLKVEFPIPVAHLVSSDPTKVAKLAMNSVHLVLTLDPRTVQLLQNGLYKSALQAMIGYSIGMLASAAAGNASLKTANSMTDPLPDTAPLLRGVNGLWPLVEGDELGYATA